MKHECCLFEHYKPKEIKMLSWDDYFLSVAKTVSIKSKDPSTQVGCVIVRPDHSVASTGYNGFPRRINDAKERYEDRDTKYKYVMHSEPNAIISARENLDGCTIYTWPFPPCAHCTKFIIQAGITRVVAPEIPERLKERWMDDMLLSESMFKEAGVKYEIKSFPS